MHRNFIYSSNKEKTLSNRVLSDTRVSMVLTPGCWQQDYYNKGRLFNRDKQERIKKINSIFHANIACPETSWLKFTIKTDRDR